MKKISIIMITLSCVFTVLSPMKINAEEEVETTSSPQVAEEVIGNDVPKNSPVGTSEEVTPVTTKYQNPQPTGSPLPAIEYPTSFASIFTDPGLAQAVADNFFRDANELVTQEELLSITNLFANDRGIGNDLSGLEELSNLQVLNLGINNITDFNCFEWSQLPALFSLDLTANQISDLSQVDFNTLPLLSWLGLGYNNISTLEGVDWTPLTELESLYLDNNKLSDLSKCQWVGLNNLKYLILEENGITTLSNADWTGLDTILGVAFGFNEITAITTSDFEGLSTMITFDLRNNAITDISTIDWSYFPALHRILLEHNKISDINSIDWSGLKTVTTLGLRYNEISDISGIDWTAFDEFWYIELSDNHIRDLSSINWGALSKLTYIGVENQTVELTPADFEQILSLDSAIVDYHGDRVEASVISDGGTYDAVTGKITWNLQDNTLQLSYEWNQTYMINDREMEYNGTVTLPLGQGYKVVFKDYDNSILLSEIKKAGAPVTVPAVPTRVGYEFKEWKLVSTIPTSRVLNTTGVIHKVVPTYNIEYIATYSPIVNPQPNTGRTCQDDGYAAGYYWNGTACVLDKGYIVPNTGVK